MDMPDSHVMSSAGAAADVAKPERDRAVDVARLGALVVVMFGHCALLLATIDAGGVEIGNGVTLWGQVGVNKTLTIGDNVTVLAQSGIPGSLAGNNTYFGTPAENASIKRRELVWVKRIPELWKKVMGS